MKKEFNEKLPIYIQIIDDIKKDIVRGILKGGEKLPSVRDMAEKFQVNPNTVQRVYQELERDAITYTQRGTGTFITQDESKVKEIKLEMAKSIVTSFIDGMKSLGFSKEEVFEVLQKYIDGSNFNTIARE